MTATLSITVTGSGTADLPGPNLQAWTWAVGQEIQSLSGPLATRLVAELAPGDTQALVESTFQFPTSGAVWIGGIRFTYTSKTDGALLGLAGPYPVIITIGARTPVVVDVRSVPAVPAGAFISAMDVAHRAGMAGLATGSDLQKMSQVLGLPLPLGLVPEPQFQGALEVAGAAPRDRRQVLYPFLRALYEDRDDAVAVTWNTTNRNRLTGPASSFEIGDVGRWVELDSRLYEIIDVDTAAGTWADLVTVSSGVYGITGASWTASGSGTAYLLPFSIEEDPQLPATVTVRIWDTGSGTPTPGDYVQPAAVWLLYDNESATFAAGETLVGDTSGATATIAVVVDNGTTGALLLHDYDPNTAAFQDNEIIASFLGGATQGVARANGTTGDLLLNYDGESGGGFTVGDTVTGGDSGCVAALTGLQDDGATGVLALSFVQAPPSWVDNENLQVGGVTRGQVNGTTDADYSGDLQWLLYDAAVTAPKPGEIVTGSTSEATGTVFDVIEHSSTVGAVRLIDVVGAFQDNEALTGNLGASAAVNGELGQWLVRYDGEAAGGFASADVVRGATSSAQGTVKGLQDDGASGILVMTTSVFTFYQDNEDLYVSGTVRGAANGAAQAIPRPSGQPAWGYVTADVDTAGYPTRRPWYLAGGGIDAEIRSVVAEMVAAGVRVQFLKGGWVDTE